MPTTRKHPKRVHKSEAKGGKEREEVGSIRVAHKSPLFQKPPEPEVKCVFLDIVERSSPIRGGLAALSHVTVGRLECGSPQSRAKQPNYTRREIRKQPRRPQRCGSQPFSEPNDYPSNREHEKKKRNISLGQLNIKSKMHFILIPTTRPQKHGVFLIFVRIIRDSGMKRIGTTTVV